MNKLEADESSRLNINIVQAQNSSGFIEMGVSKKRWIILFIFFLYGISNQLQYVAFATIERETKSYYSVNALAVNMLAAVFPCIYVFGVYPGCKIYGFLGIRSGMLIGTSFNFAGSLCKLMSVLVWQNYVLLMSGQVLNGCSQVLFLGLPPLIASTWFPDTERALATAVGTLSGFLGMATGMFYSPRIASNSSIDMHTAFLILFTSQASLAFIVWSSAILFVENQPPMSPSYSAHRGTAVVAICPVLSRLIRNSSFVKLACAFGITAGLFTAVATVMAQLFHPYGVSEEQAGIISFVGILIGTIGCVVVGFTVDKYRKYKLTIIIIEICVVTGTLAMTLLMKFYSGPLDTFVGLSYLIVIVIEATLLPVFPVAFDFAVELTFPQPESVTGGSLMLLLSFTSVVTTLIFTAILGNNPSKDDVLTVFITTLSGLALALGLVCWTKENLSRLEHETSMSSPGTSPKGDFVSPM